MAENPRFSFAESVREARQRLDVELRAPAEQIRKLRRELDALQQLYIQVEREAARQWDEVGRAAQVAAAAAEAAASPDPALEGVLNAVRALVTCTTPDQVFRTLAEESAPWGVRAAVFEVRGKAAWGAAAHGFGPALTEKVLRTLIVPLNHDNSFRQVYETGGHVDASAASLKRTRHVLEKLAPAPNSPILLLPIRSTGTVSAILYADSKDGQSFPVNGLKVLAEFAGAQLDRLIALSGDLESPESHEGQGENPEIAALEAAESEPSGDNDRDGAETAVKAPQTSAPAVELAEESDGEKNHEVPVVLDHSEAGHLDHPPDSLVERVEVPVPELESAAPAADRASSPRGSEIGAEHAAVAEAAAIVDEAAQRDSEASDPPISSSDASESIASAIENDLLPARADRVDVVSASLLHESSIDVAVQEAAAIEFDVPAAIAEPMPPSEAEEKLHRDARRFARLLVSEIELYNKAKVADGRRNNDLYSRLKADIDRSRQTFERRFAKSLGKQFDYFHDELVRTLALNDASLLGPDYPGSSA